ncbi:nucleolin isoform X2 [Zeugodacus cucurbitae]|uniref:nucleolin isoform X2 n=1 Tax=Zeugodacus cucurbitae TaxID=28588 RepID=UPI0005968A4E|nr:nucleolin isoform X2 [Zeugodacus cucurbitae]
MNLAPSFIILIQLFCAAIGSLLQRSPYSLQGAVDELHHRDVAKYPLNAPPSQSYYFNGAFNTGTEQDYWNDDFQPTSIFREREIQKAPTSVTVPEHSELTKEFLREIEDAQEFEREDHFKETLRNLLEQYQQQENDIEDSEFEEKKRMRMPPFYMLMQKKRSYPVLPWLPYSERKKRFPVAKRSTKTLYSGNMNLGKTDEKVTQELSELFGSSSSSTSDEKRKRSTDEQTQTSFHGFTALAPTFENATLLKGPSNKQNVTNTDKNIDVLLNEHSLHIPHIQKEHKHRKRSDHHGSHESHDEEEGSTESEEREDEEGEEEDEEEFEEEDLEKRKKKRDLNIVKKFLRDENFPSQRTDNLRQKKSIDWSTYFGIDRKKKDTKSPNEEETAKNEQEKKSRDLNREEIKSMDRKLQSIEDFIIDETIKYTGAHEGIANPDEIRRLKDHVLSRLATAYSLEKMRRALEKLRKYVEADNHLLRNVIEPDDGSENGIEKRLSVKKEQATEQDLENNSLSSANDITKEINTKTMMGNSRAYSTIENIDIKSRDNSENVKKRKKKLNSYVRYPELPNNFKEADEDVSVGLYETLNDAYLGNKNYIIGSNQCPLIKSMVERCSGVEFLSVDTNQELLPICGVYQICYLCGTSQMACDYQYLAEADSICGDNNDCQASARSILMILRGTVTQQLGPKECMKNSCFRSAMREIGL